MAYNKKDLQVTKEDKRTFNYSKGNVTLNFTLRTDITMDLIDFKELLKLALDDVSMILDEIKKKK